MKVVVAGAGPVGLVGAYALAERGHDVDLVDPDPGPSTPEEWRRRGVMQFMHPHLYRWQVRDALRTHAPAMLDAVLAAGGVESDPPPGAPAHLLGLSCRRSVFERALRHVAVAHPRMRFHCGSVSDVLSRGGRVSGVRIGREYGELEADLVVVASGRTSRLGDELRPESVGGACGLSYVARMYKARDGVEVPVGMPLNHQYTGYQAVVFPQDARTISTLLVRPASDDGYTLLWREEAFQAAMAAIPGLAQWTDPDCFDPITAPMRGGTLTNTYRAQGDLPAGLVFLGDAVCTTNPAGGRGISLGLGMLSELLRRLDEHGAERDLTEAVDAWAESNVKPWYDDHRAADAWTVQRYAGGVIDPEGPIPPGVIAAAALDDRSLIPVIGPYLLMLKLPGQVLPDAEPLVRAKLRDGWRPPVEAGPSRDELVEVMERALVDA